MGSFNISCGLSNIDIIEGDEIVLFLVGRRLSDGKPEVPDNRSQTDGFLFPNTLFGLLSPFHITGTYDDYGSISIDKNITNNEVIKVWSKMLGLDIEETKDAVSSDSAPNFTYMFCGDTEWTYSCAPFFIRKDVFEYCMKRTGLDYENAANISSNLLPELKAQCHKSNKSLSSFTASDRHSWHNFFCGIETFKELDTVYRKTYRSLSLEAMTLVCIENVGQEGDPFLICEQSQEMLIEAGNSTDENFPFASLYLQLCQRMALQHFVRAMNMIFRPSSYSGQETKADLFSSVYKGFANIADTLYQKKITKMRDSGFFNENKIEENSGIAVYNFTKE